MIKIPGLDNYLGCKGSMGTAERIINHIRPHDTLVIPFAGHCAITRKIRWPARVLLNDLDPAVVQAWQAANLGPQVEISNLPALDFLKLVLARTDLGRLVVYCDPPYPHETRAMTRTYNREMSRAQHVDFLDAIRWLRIDCLVSTYPNDLYRQQLSAWNLVEYQSMTRGGQRTEWLFFNYPSPTVLHDGRFGGENYRQREYAKRKAGRWVKRFQEMPAHEQQLILSQVLSTAPDALVQQLVQEKKKGF